MEDKLILSKDMYVLLIQRSQRGIPNMPVKKVHIMGETEQYEIDVEIDHLSTEPIMIAKGKGARALLESIFTNKIQVSTDNQRIVSAAEEKLDNINVTPKTQKVRLATLGNYPSMQYVTEEGLKGIKQTDVPIAEYDVTFETKTIWEVKSIERI